MGLDVYFYKRNTKTGVSAIETQIANRYGTCRNAFRLADLIVERVINEPISLHELDQVTFGPLDDYEATAYRIDKEKLIALKSDMLVLLKYLVHDDEDDKAFDTEHDLFKIPEQLLFIIELVQLYSHDEEIYIYLNR